MAAFTHSEPQLINGQIAKPSFLRRLFERMIDARMAQARQEVANHIEMMDEKTRERYDIDRAVVGKKGVFAWPY